MIDIKKILEEGGPMKKYDGIAPDGFILITEGALEELKVFDTWKEWKNNTLSIKELNNRNFPEI
jgi:hypothetical protein